MQDTPINPDRSDELKTTTAWPSRGYAWFVVVILALSLTLSMMDRMILALMIDPIKRDLGLSDVQVSLVHGLAFTLLYIFVGLPMGRIADRWSRRGLAAISIVGWSAMTLLCGLANNFGQLFAGRMGVGIGEAGLSPATVSLISDYFPPQERGRPLAFMTIGTTAGAGLALIFGGSIVQAIGASGEVLLPLIGLVKGWQAVFIVLGVFGILFAAVYLLVKEPVRQERIFDANSAPAIGEVLAFALSRKRFLIAHFLGASFAVLVSIGYMSWIPTMFIRNFGWSPLQAGTSYGLCVMIAGVTAILSAGWLSDWLSKRGRRDAPLMVAAIAAALAVLPMAIAPLLSTPPMILSALFIGTIFLTMPSALAPVSLQAVCPNEMRGQIFAIYLFILSLLGYAVGPFAVALFGSLLFGDDQHIHISLAIVGAIFIPLSTLCLTIARKNCDGKKQIA